MVLVEMRSPRFSHTELLKLCRCCVISTGNIFLGASHADTLAMLEMYAKRKRITLQHMNVSHKALLSPGTKARLEEAEDFAISKKHNIYLQKHRILPNTIPEELLQEEWFFDISQNWHRNKGCCSSVPTLLCGSNIWSEEVQRLLHPKELLAAQGLFSNSDNIQSDNIQCVNI